MSDAIPTNGSIDKDGNGLVDAKHRYVLATDADTPLLLKNWKGRTYSDASTPLWNAIQSVQHEDGFQVLCEGEGKKEGQFSWMSVNADGRINGKSGWQAANNPSTQHWEQIFGDVIQKDGVIGKASDDDGNGFLDHRPHYQIYTGGRSVPLTAPDGKTLSKKTSRNWKALKAISTSDGFQILVGSRGRKQQRFRVLDVDLDGQINQKTAWTKGAKALFSGWNTQFRNLLLNQNSKGGVKAASTGGDNADGQLIYTAIADDSSQVTYALKDEGQGFDGVLNIDQNSGEVRLHAEKLREIVKDISFTVTTTDGAGNSSEWPIRVTLIPQENTEDNEQEAGDNSAAGGISALSVDPTDLSDQTPEALGGSDVSNTGEEEILVSEEQEADNEADNNADTNSETENTVTPEASSDNPEKINKEESNSDVSNTGEEEIIVSEGQEDANEADNNADTNNDTENTETPEASSDNPEKINEEESNDDSDVDTTPKENSSGLQKPSTPILLADSDGGNGQSDGLTNINTPTLIGTATANATVELESEQDLLGTTTADSDGNWSFTLKSAEALNDGSHTITARVSAEDGEASERSEALTLTVDTRAPELSSDSTSEAEILVAKGTLDQNNDGLVDGTNQSQILHKGSGIKITRSNGVTKGNSINRKWGYQILKAIPSTNGYELLLKGTGTNHRGKYSIWSTDQAGLITKTEPWTEAEYALRNGWEAKFSGDWINGDGVITAFSTNTYFVAPDGDDNNLGTIDQPFKTISWGAQQLQEPGDTLNIRGGTYRLAPGKYDSHSYFIRERKGCRLVGRGQGKGELKCKDYGLIGQKKNLEHSVISLNKRQGTKDHPIRIQSYQGEEVIITGAQKTPNKWVRHEGNIWKTKIYDRPAQLFLDGEMLTGARHPNITKNWHEYDESNSNNITPGSYWHPESWIKKGDDLPSIELDGAVLVPLSPDGGAHVSWIDKKAADSNEFTLSPYASGHEPFDHQRGKHGQSIRSSVPEQFFLTSHLDLLDQPGEWHVEMRDKLQKVNTSYGKDYIWKPLHNDLYVWLPDGDDPNDRNIEARTFNKMEGDPGVEDRLLEIKDASHIEVNGLTFKAGDIHLMRTTDTTIQNSRFIHSGHHLHMIGDKHSGNFPAYSSGKSVDTMVNQMGYGGERGKEIYEMDHNLTIKDSEFIGTYGGTFLTWGKGVSGNTLENVYFRNKVGGYAAFEIGRNSYNNNINRLEYHTFGWGGIGRIGQGSYEDYEYGKESNYPKSKFQLMRIYNPFWHGDDSGVQVNQAQVFNTTFKNNWFHDLPGRNGLRFDGNPSGFGGTVNNNVSFNNRRGFRIKGDFHNVINNIAFQNSNNDVRVSGDKFYGWREGRNCAPSDQMQRNGKWYCNLYPNNPNSIINSGNINSIIHNNAGDKPSDVPVANPNNKTGNSMSKDSRGGRLLTEELRDIKNFDFRPKTGSSLIDAGTHIPEFTDGFRGSAPDIGAYEYGDTDYWIPGYQTKKAKTPIPSDGANNAKIDTDLIWLEGRHSISNNIYFGPNPSDLQFQGNQSNNIFTPNEPLEAGQTYYWRIDTVTEDKTIPGDLWVFTPVNADTPKAPDAPILDPESDSGISKSDGITNNNTPRFSGTGNAGDTIQLFQSSIALGTAEVGADGIWSYTVPQDFPLQDGINVITAKTSIDGISSAISESLIVTVDTSAPIFTSTEILPAIDENSGSEKIVHRVETTDQTAATYSFPSENTNDTTQFSIDSTTGQLKLIPNPNFEDKNEYSIRIDALDLAGNRNTQTVNLSIKDRLETDLNLDGLLDGSGQTQILNDGKVITIRDQSGEPKGNDQDAKTGYTIIKAVEDEDEFRILIEGTGTNHIGKFLQWKTDQSGNITAQSVWQKPNDALDLGWEYYFGDVIKKDGFIGQAPAIDANGDGIVDDTNQSKIYHDERAIPIQYKDGTLKGNYEDLKSGYEVIQAAPSESGFDLLLKGNGKQNLNQYKQWNTNADGVIIGRSGWESDDFAVSNGWENQFGDIIKTDGHVGLPPAEDSNDDGLVDGLREPFIFDAGSGLAIISRSGKIKRHSNSKKTGYKVIKAVSREQGFAVLLKGEGAKTKGKFLQWTTDEDGNIIKNSGWKPANISVADGWEDQFGDIIQPDGVIGRPAVAEGPAMLDQNNDGFVDGTNQSQILDDNTGLPITDRRGRVKSNWKNRKWGYNILKAIPKDEGFDVLLKGSGKKNRSRFLIWSTNPSGMITGNTGWKKIPFALKNDWESEFGDLIQPNGIID